MSLFDYFLWGVVLVCLTPIVVYLLVRVGALAYFRSKKDYYYQLWHGERGGENGKRSEKEERN